ncbi:MAG: urea ABC transporter substrate-binding protein [Mariprofundales bacterium]|nr:urea ABC transporter substrate-binding protein [Mariprofundales bacterium]
MNRKIIIALLLLTITGGGALLYPRMQPSPIKVGILHSLTGTMAMSEKPVVDATMLAIDDINAHGGLLGRQVEAVIVDGHSDAATFAKGAERLITQDHVAAIFGCWTSASRKMVKSVVEKHHHLLLYPVQSEGLEASPNIIYTGATANQQIVPALVWAVHHLGKRIYLLGSDYIFPRSANFILRRYAAAAGATIVGERYIPLGSKEMAATLADIRRTKPDVVLNTINGDSNIALFRALQRAGIRAKKLPVLSFSIGETELVNMKRQGLNLDGNYTASSYLQSIKSTTNRTLVDAMRYRYGANTVVNDPMEGAWIAVHLWAGAVKAAESSSIEQVLPMLKHQTFQAPEGLVSIDADNNHLWKRLRIGRIKGQKLTTIYRSPQPIPPQPWPDLISQSEADAMLQSLWQRWHGHWSAPTTATLTR